ncbi:MAG: acetolactate decarboxylase [Candidatus Omnitrophica bacterium]|nr:acetolactate decarboxylase [Candidatus Omnitrophota bacterium]MBU1869908.1 acetolactate decarboxylase [Candidatus Omnitrophota bacterium]
MRKPIFKKIVLIFFIFVLSGCASFGQSQKRDRFFQVSTIDALMQGLYEGQMTFGQLRSHGDFGIGTFEGLDGEMVALDGKFYQVQYDGKAYPVKESMKTPFAVVTFFVPDKKASINDPLDDKELQQYLLSLFQTRNLFYAIRIEGEFSYMKTRSVARQAKPYPSLAEAVKNQSVFEFRDCQGTMVGFYVPGYFKGLNAAGFHFHFLTQDKKEGGHVLGFKVTKAAVSLSPAQKLCLVLPDSKEF